MRRLIAAEIKKLMTTRSAYILMAGVAAIAVVTVQDPAHSAATFEKPFHEQTFLLFTSLLTRILILVLGIRVITDELRHGTIVPSLLVTPRRGHLLAAKGISVAVFGAFLAAIAWIAMSAAASMLAASEGATLALGKDAWRSLGGTVAAGASWGIIGLGLGAIVRSQIVATVGGLVWLMGVEDGIRGWLGDLAGYLPGQAALALTTAPSGRIALVAGATVVAYASVVMVGAALAMRRDVT